MIPILPALKKDAYKIGHPAQYPRGTTMVYSNLTPRGTRREPAPYGVIACGFQYWVKSRLLEDWTQNFFQQPRHKVMKEYQRIVDHILGPGTKIDHIGELHELGYLPLLVKAVPEGTLVPYRVPVLTIRNTIDRFYWLTNMVETDLSNTLWKPTTSATTAFYMRREFEAAAQFTGANRDFIKWQGHDFSYRGMSGLEDACLSAMGHLLSFTGTDTVPVIPFLENYYYANIDEECVGGSIPATEHSVMCMGLKGGELDLIKWLITEVYPKGPVSVVSDTWDFWKVVTQYLPQLKSIILSRDGKLVVRPDSGDPVKILCGDPDSGVEHIYKGLVTVLYEIFRGTQTAKGYKVLDSHIGDIYGDSITPERQKEILSRLAAKGFASSNVVLGVGSFTYEYVTRDTDGWALKATYGEVTGVDGPCGVNISKDPKTDSGLKKSAEGLLRVYKDVEGEIRLVQRVEWADEQTGLLQPIFWEGTLENPTSLKKMRALVESQL